MSLRVVAVTGPRELRYRDRSVVVVKDGREAGRVPVEDLAVLVLDGPDLVLSHQLLAACAEANVAVITSDEKHLPNGLLMPLVGHTLHSETLRGQIEASVPNRKRTWQGIVKAKILAQAELVGALGMNETELRRLVPLVRSGDPDNVEARAAARYFEKVFGGGFVREREAPGLNAMLNYGYAVLRSTVARAVVGSGLHAALGVYHRNRYNPFCLVDDAMEPLRPMVDAIVKAAEVRGEVPDELDPPTKRALLRVLTGFVTLDGLRFPLLVGLERYAAGLRRAILEGELLVVPRPCVREVTPVVYEPAGG